MLTDYQLVVGTEITLVVPLDIQLAVLRENGKALLQVVRMDGKKVV